MQFINETVRNAIRNGIDTPINADTWLRGYLTPGGTYILTQTETAARQNDNGRAHDMIAFDRYGNVHPLTPMINPDLLAEAHTVLS